MCRACMCRDGKGVRGRVSCVLSLTLVISDMGVWGLVSSEPSEDIPCASRDIILGK